MRVKSRLWVLKFEGLRDRKRNERGREGGREEVDVCVMSGQCERREVDVCVDPRSR